jgi:ankyrin repeat protein
MPTEKASIFTIAEMGDLENFKKKFRIEDINKKSEYGSSLLHYSIEGNKFDISLFLIENGIDLNLIDSEGNTALHYIGNTQNVEIAKLILEKGADLEIRNKYGNNNKIYIMSGVKKVFTYFLT